MIKAVLFDKDGVLMDSEAEYERRRQIFFSERGIDASGFPDFYGSNNDVIWRTVEPNDAERRARLAVEFVERFKDEPMIYADYVYPAVRSTLEALRARGILTALASSSPRKFIDRFLDETGLTELFDYTVSGEECENHKPAPDVYLRAMEALGVHPDEVLSSGHCRRSGCGGVRPCPVCAERSGRRPIRGRCSHRRYQRSSQLSGPLEFDLHERLSSCAVSKAKGAARDRRGKADTQTVLWLRLLPSGSGEDGFCHPLR